MNHAPQPPTPTGGKRAVGCFSILSMLTAIPLVALGFLIYLGSDDAGAANSGIAGGLAGLGSVAGIVLIAIGACGFILGAVLYARSASD